MTNRCAFCDRTFDSDVDSDECPACKQKVADELEQRARDEAKDIPAPAPEDRKWSRAWMKRDV
jgi:hypothetical protein